MAQAPGQKSVVQDYLRKLFAHEHWANRKLVAALRAAAKVPPRTEELLSHILNTHRFWELRVHGQPIPEFNFWHLLSLDQCETLNEEYARKWPEYIRSLPEPIEKQVVNFTAFDGTPRTFRAVDILTQLHSHSVHHRAQIMLDMKASGLEPVTTDYLLFCRKSS